MRRLLTGSITLLLLSGCGSSTVRDTLGLTHRAPDEFRVVSRPPLSVPPEFNLRPPAGPGEVSANTAQPAYRQAESLVRGDVGDTVSPLKAGMAETAVQPVESADLGSGAQSAARPQAADSVFLQKAGAVKADAGIRQELQQETAAEENAGLLDKLSEPSSANQPVVNARQESDRLKTDKEQGKPPTEGDTPMSSPKDTGPLGRILGY